jgi:hypothetical protein
MPFSKYHAEPAHMEAMRSAFQKVCDALRLNCGVDDRIIDVIVTKIVAIAKTGELDPDRLSERVLRDLRP